jgi:hypothetical protein
MRSQIDGGSWLRQFIGKLLALKAHLYQSFETHKIPSG